MKFKKEKKTAAEIILSILQSQAQLSVDLAMLFLKTPYKGIRFMNKNTSPVILEDWAALYRKRKIFYTRLAELKKQGFVETKENRLGSFLSITKNGAEHLIREKSRTRSDYKKQQSERTIIVSYDIPEKKSRERKWLREILRFLDFEMIHKSVWIGTIIIPEELFHDMRKKEIVEYVHVFEVGKKGTIKKLSQSA